jgi:hypothetical protein
VGGLRAVEGRTFAVRRDLVDDALVARAGKDIARLVDDQSPDIALRRIEEDGALASSIDPVDFAFRRGRGINTAGRRDGNRMYFELFGIEEDAALAAGVDAEDLSFVARADEERSIRRAHQTP